MKKILKYLCIKVQFIMHIEWGVYMWLYVFRLLCVNMDARNRYHVSSFFAYFWDTFYYWTWNTKSDIMTDHQVPWSFLNQTHQRYYNEPVLYCLVLCEYLQYQFRSPCLERKYFTDWVIRPLTRIKIYNVIITFNGYDLELSVVAFQLYYNK